MRNIIKPTHIRSLLQLSKLIDKVTEFVGKSIAWLVLLTIAVGFYNVIARYVGRLIGIKLSSNSLIELQWYLFSLMFLLGFAYILKQAVNVRVDFIYDKWNEKRRALVDFLGTVFFLIPFCVMGILIAINPVLQSWGLLPDGTWGGWEISADADGLPRAPIKTMLIVGFTLLLAQSISQAIKYLAVIKGYLSAADIARQDVESLPLE